MAFTTKRIRERRKNASDDYDIIHRETEGSLTILDDSTTVQEHVDSFVASTEGVHGFRYNTEAEALEFFNEGTGEWEDISSGGGVALANVVDIETVVSSGKVYLRWTDPSDIVASGATIAEWAGTLLIRKAGSAPANRKDGTIVIDSKAHTYSTNFLLDSGLTNGVTYYYKFFPYTTEKVYTDSPDNMVSVTPNTITPNNITYTSVASAGNGKISLRWGDPNNKVIDGITVSEWAGTKVVYKTGSYPTSPEDGTLVINNTTKDMYRSDPLMVSGLTNGVTYYFSFFPYSTDGVVNTNTNNRMSGVANRMMIDELPFQSNSLTYNGYSQSPVWDENFNSSWVTASGTTSSVNAGTFTATLTPLDDYMWFDNTTTSKNITWTIAKAVGSSSINRTSMVLDMSSSVGQIAVTRSGDGVISAVSSNTSVATVSISGNVVTVNSVSQTNGTSTITISVAAGTNHTAPSNKTCSVTASFVSTTLNNNTWAVIRQVSDAGQGANYWSVGDAKQITINGTIGKETGINYTTWAFILGFNHNSSREGTNRIHFQIGRTAQTYSASNAICLIDSTYNAFSSTTGSFAMNPASNSSGSINSGGWSACKMRSDVLGSASSPTSPASGTFLAALPSDLRVVMKSCVKYSDNTAGGSNVAAYVTTTTDYLFLLSEFEVYGIRSQANSAEQIYQLQYDYYKNGNSKIKYKYATTGDAGWWLRSAATQNIQYFCLVANYDASIALTSAGYCFGVAPAFCV